MTGLSTDPGVTDATIAQLLSYAPAWCAPGCQDSCRWHPWNSQPFFFFFFEYVHNVDPRPAIDSTLSSKMNNEFKE